MANSPQIAATTGIGRLLAVNVVDPRAREFLIIKDRLTLGSDETNDLVVRDNAVSRRHARLSFAHGRCIVEDLGSTNGTFLNNRRIDKAEAFDKGDRLRFGAAEFVFMRSARSQPAPTPSLPSPAPVPTPRRRRKTKKIGDRARLAALDGAAPKEIALARRTAIIGRAPQSAIAIEHASISDRHAKLTRRFGRYALKDLGSAHGTFVNGQRVSSKRRLARGDEIRFGSLRFVFMHGAGKRRRLSLLRVALTLLLLFLAGVAATEYYIIRSLNRGPDQALAPKGELGASQKHPAAAVALKPAQPAAARSAVPPAPERGSDWLKRLNFWRTIAGLPPVAIDTVSAAGVTAHSHYMVENALAHNAEIPHREQPGHLWYSAAGASAAEQSDFLGPGPRESPSMAIDYWIDGPLHRLTLLDRRLKAAAYASYCDGALCAENLYLDSPSHEDPLWFGEMPEPVMFPGDRATLPSNMLVLITGEWPAPLSLTCTGYRHPAGYPVTLQLDQRFVPKLVAYSFSRNGSQIDACGYDSLTYANSDPGTQNWGREGLRSRGALVIIPRAPLTPGTSYEVAVTVEAQSDPFGWGKPSPFAGQRRSYNWAFTVAP